MLHALSLPSLTQVASSIPQQCVVLQLSYYLITRTWPVLRQQGCFTPDLQPAIWTAAPRSGTWLASSLFCATYRAPVRFLAKSCAVQQEKEFSSSSCGCLSPSLVLCTEEFLLAPVMLLLCRCQENNWEPLAFLSSLNTSRLCYLAWLFGTHPKQFHRSLTTEGEFIHNFFIPQETIRLSQRISYVYGPLHFTQVPLQRKPAVPAEGKCNSQKSFDLSLQVYIDCFHSPKTVLYFSFEFSWTCDHLLLVMALFSKSESTISCFVFLTIFLTDCYQIHPIN